MGMAYLPDGSVLDYGEYIRSHPHWQTVRLARYRFDEGRCVICRKKLTEQEYQTHHLHYQRLGNERMRDVITLCYDCHREFHHSWERSQYWKGKEPGHWEIFSLQHTAKLCAHYWKGDKFICKDPEAPNMCSRDVCRQLLDDYFTDFELQEHPRIDPNDVLLFVRNKRYEMFFEAESRGLTVEEFLDECYGPKIRGKTPLRTEAGKKNGTFDHTPKSFHRHYIENNNINILMKEVQKYEKGN